MNDLSIDTDAAGDVIHRFVRDLAEIVGARPDALVYACEDALMFFEAACREELGESGLAIFKHYVGLLRDNIDLYLANDEWPEPEKIQ